MDYSRLFSAEHWFDPNPGPPSLVYAFLASLFAAVLGFSIYLNVARGRFVGDNRLKARLVRQIANIGIVLGAVGLALVFARFLAVPYISMRALVYIVLLLMATVIIYYAYYLLRVFPGRLAFYETEMTRRRYMPKPGGPVGRRRRGKRRR